ncbi:HAD family hydrolase [Alteraurantiacibacter buctensis]|uniref:HAD family hydrolase n=1 Tax=Alteraurantiacibacter buctensis TaxID=1503981 RepID=A0A844YVI2_9SPHN|nr:HAD family hydrolase [Alteraurantiacibacter buctensis]MXO71152.1 HAD family hydrolase [Alteraurantiacibacter buctensis]
MTHTVLPHEVPALLDRFPDARCLSLDCFDTLLWRDCHAPVDLFTALPGVARAQRVGAEGAARKARALAGKGTEVSLAEIHARLHPNGSAAGRAQSAAEELAAEARHCHGFAPVVALMQAAKARGMEVVIVSDTYLDAAQLRALIAAAAGANVAALIDQVFCSSKFGLSKGAGLYGQVLKKLRHAPHEIVHLGDNFHADVEGVAPLGVNAVHLVQFADEVRQRLRLEASADALLHPHCAPKARALQPHRAALSLAEPLCGDAAERLGASVLGPVFHAFHHWLDGEAAALEAAHGGRVHKLFLMRDGYLPLRVHRELGGTDGHELEISRFTATAAHFTSDAAITAFVEDEIGLRPTTLARQMLLPEERIASLLEPLSMEDGTQALLKETRTGPFRKALLRASRAFADRLQAHLRATCKPQAGDTLMLVDLGYNGTVQNRVAALLASRLKVHVAGRYLVLREKEVTGLDKRGLIDARHYAPEVLEGFCANVALLEQLCTKAQGSVVDYTPDGTPLRGPNDIKQQQSAVREAVQQGCLAFQRAARNAVVRTPCDHAPAMWREAAASVLARAMFLPLPAELAVVEAFEHDVNLGTQQTVPLFDRAVAARGLKQRGLFYMNGAERMLLPAEIDREGLATRLSLMVHRLFDPPFAYSDFGQGGVALDVTLVDPASGQVARRQVQATPTHDGFYTAAIPVGEGRFAVAAHIGQLAEWFEVESAVHVPVADFISGKHEALRRETVAHAAPEGIGRMADRLWHSPAADGHLLFPPPADSRDEPVLLALTFRPLVLRQTRAAAGQTTPAAERTVA